MNKPDVVFLEKGDIIPFVNNTSYNKIFFVFFIVKHTDYDVLIKTVNETIKNKDIKCFDYVILLDTIYDKESKQYKHKCTQEELQECKRLIFMIMPSALIIVNGGEVESAKNLLARENLQL